MDSEDVMLEEDLELEDGSDDGEVDEEYIADPPSAQASSGHASPPTSYTSSPPVLGEEPPSPRVPFSVAQHLHFTGKPAGHIRRRPGRPRKEFSGIVSREQQKTMKRYRTGARGISKRPRFSREERGELIANLESFSVPQSPGEDSNALDPETGALVPYDKTERVMPAPEDLPSFNEKWPGKLCSLCNLSERSQLGQGELLRYQCPEGGFTIVKKEITETDESSGVLSFVGSGGDKSPRTGIGPQLSNRRQKSLNKCKNPSINSEYTDELEKIGHSDIIEPSSLLEPSGHFYIHSSCATWSIGAEKNEDEIVEHIRPIIVQSMTRKCFHCNHYGASLTCKMSCPKYFHFPCAAASGGFQDIQTYSTFCKEHLGQVPLVCSEDIHCRMCNALGDVGNLMMCSACGDHYHGACAGVAQLPGVRAGWQCKICRWCQICRMPGDEGRSLFCEQCDKLYHPQCLRPQLASIPKYGWKCKCCRMCSDCGSRTPGAGLSSRWHAHFTVCDSCYQQRNKGFCCPLCHRAYRAAAYREMVQCHTCKKFVHGTCDSGADLTSYQQRKDISPDYEYICPICKSIAQASIKRNSIEDDLSATDPLSIEEVDDSTIDKIDYGLGKGKPYLAGKIAKKRLGITAGAIGRPKGSGKGFPGKFGYQKRQKMTEFGRKRGPKGKMRGIFGVPGLGLQRPVADANFPKSEDEPGVENRLVLCSAKDKFVLTQDICVMCGSLGTDQEGCLISCAQCGQCYHPYCVNVKVTKVILTKGWRCLDCTVCEGCGFRNDESRLILCDDCDISYHIYCMDPPLDFVPHGNWKCKWCAICQVCGTNDPGFNCSWMNSYTECGPCSSHNTCASCHESYNDAELIIQCSQCERWLHCACDSIKTEADAERCVSEGYACNMCRPRDVPPPHLVPLPPPPKIVEIVKSPEVPKVSMGSQFFMDGVCLSASGMQQMRSLTIEQTGSRKKRKPKLPLVLPVPQDKEANILATIESVVAGGSLDNSLEDSRIDDKEDPSEIYRDGMVWNPKGGNTGPPEGFTVYTTEAGLMILRRKRQRNLQKLGIGGFNVRMRGIRREKDEDDSSVPPTPLPLTPNVVLPDASASTSNTQSTAEFEKPKRKPVRRKPKSKLMECYPSYLQEAFFGRDLLDTTKVKDVESSSSEEEVVSVSADKTITLSHDELKVIEAMREKKMEKVPKPDPQQSNNQTTQIVKDEKPQLIKQEARDDGDISDTDTLKDVLGLPNDLLDNDLVNRIMNEDDDLTKTSVIDELPDPALQDASSLNETNDQKDDLGDILGQHFNIESMVRDSLPNMDSKDVEEIFKGVLTDESQESQESSIFPISSSGSSYVPHSAAPSTVQSVQQAPSIVTKALPSPMGFPSPYSEYSSSPQFSPVFSEPQSPWVGSSGDITPEDRPVATPTSYNQRSTDKMKQDEVLGMQATISAVLYANCNHPEWKTEYPIWNDRYKQILKKWRSLPTEKKTSYLQLARENRSALRIKKTQQIPKDASTAVIPNPALVQKPAGRVTPIQQPPQMAAVVAGIIQSNTSEPEVQDKDGNTINELTHASPTNTASLTPTNTSSNPLASGINSNPSIEPKVESADTSNVCEKQTPVIQNFNVKNVSIVRNAVSFSPNISVAHQSTPQFTVHHQYSLNHSGPAPNVTVNPNGNFNPTSSSIRNNHNFSTNIHFTPLIRTNFHANLSLIHHNINAVVQHNPTFTFNPVNIHTNQVANVIQLNPVTTSNAANAVNIPYPSPAPSPFANTSIINNSGKGKVNVSATDGLSQPTSSRSQSPCYSPKTPNTPHTPNRSITPTTPVARTPTPNLQINFISTGKTCHTTSYSATTSNSNQQLTLSPIHGSSSPNLSDQQIRVLTPSEIMRTLPSLCQDNYDPPLPGAQTTDPDKTTQHKTVREAEQERQWKQLQAQRQQQAQQTQQVIQDQRVLVSEKLIPAMARVHRQLTADGTSFSHDQHNLTQQLQVSTNQEISLGPLASPSPNSRNQFMGSQGKNRIAPPQSPSFTHPNLPPPSLVQRPNALNLPRQGPNLVRPVAAQNISTPAEHLQRLTQSPFSPQPPQSPHEFPGSMSPAHGGQIDNFSRPPSESGSIENYNQSPHTPRSFGHQSPNPQRSPAYVSQTRVVNEGYVQAPGTPRPQFNSPTPRPQVYLGMRNEYTSQTQPFSSPRPDHFVNQSGQNQPTEINRQLRDLLQRQQAPNQQRLQVLYGQDSQQINPEPVIQTSESQSHGDATFRQPLPPGLVRPRVQGNTGAIIKPPVSVGQLGNMSRPQLQNIQDHGRGRMILQPGMVGQNLQRPVVQQYIQNPRMPQRSNASEQFDHLTQQRSVQFPGKNQDAVLLSQRLGRQPEPLQMSPRLTQTPMSVQQQRNAPVVSQQLPVQPPAMTPLQTAASTLSNQPSNISLPSPSPNSSSPSGGLTSEPPEIPDSVTAELDRLEQEGNGMAEVEGVGDILGGLGDDDDALLVSLTAEMGADFNILEYADPELDALSDGEKTNILDSLELDEPDPEQEKPHVKKEPEERDERIKSEQEIMSHEDKHKPDKKIKQEIIAPSISEAHKLSDKQMPPLTVTQTQLSHKNIPVSMGHMSKGLPIQQPNLQLHSNLNQNPQHNQSNQQSNQNPQLPQQSDNMGQLHQNVNNQQAILQQQIINQPMQQVAPSLQQQQQIQQQMQHQVQQAAAMGRAMIPGTRLMSPDGAVGIVTANNTVTVSYPGLLQQRHLHVHQPRIQMRMGPNGQQQRVVQVGPSSLQHQQMSVPRMGIAPPPPPPYPGPPPPYPGPLQQQMGVRLPPRPVPSPGPGALGAMLGHHNQLPQPLPIPRRPLLLQHSSQEQPLLLEELLEQEKREQERQQIPGDTASQVGNLGNTSVGQSAPTALLTDQEFERLRADIVGSAGPLPLSSPPQGIPAQGLLPVQTNPAIRAPLPPRTTTPAPWQTVPVRTPVQKPVPQTPPEPRIPLFAQPCLPPPPLPPEIIQNEQDRQAQMHYEQWLTQQNQIVTQQLKYYDTEVQKLRKIRKSLNSKQRQLRKSGNELTETDAGELTRISADQAFLQKHLENARKQSRQHGMLIQEYRNKQQARQAGNSPAPQSPLLSPSPGPLQHQPPASPMHSPGNLLAASQSPGPGSVGSILQSPGNHGNSNSSMSPHHMQPSPRIGTPHSQTDENPFSPTSGPTPSPSSLPTRMVSPARMTSPQHRIVGQPAGLVGNRSAPSPTGYPQTQYQNQRFVRPTLVEGQRPRLNMPPVFLQGARPGFSAAQLPLGSPQPIMSSGVNTAVSQCISQQADALQTQRTMQLVQQRRLMQQQQQQLQQQQQQQLLQQQQQPQQQQLQQQPNLLQTQTTIAQQQLHHHQMLAQQQALAKQQMSHMQQQSGNQRSPMHQPPSSPLNPRSPMLQSLSQQIMNQGQTGMTHQQSMSSQNQPQSPMSRGMVHGQYGQPPSSPMLPKSPLISQAGVHGGSPLSGMRRPPSTGGPISSPSSLPDRPHSRENLDPPRTPLTPYQHNPDLADGVEHAYNMGGGGGNPHNPQNPAPKPPGFGRFGYIKLGLRGGAPMWGTFGRGFKRIPTASGGKEPPGEKSIDQSPGKMKKEAHINKVSILKKKIPKPATITSTPAQAIPISKVTSLVCADYNEFDDSSSTPPISPAPSTSQQHDKKINKTINIGKKLPEELVTETEQEVQMQEIVVIDSSPDEKQQILDYDDDNEKLVGAEVSLSSVAQPEDDITVIETFATGDLEEIVSSPLESEVAEEYVLFSSDMVVDYGVDSDDSMKHYVQKTTEEGEYSQQEITELGDKNVEIVNVSLESPNESSDEESSSKNDMHKGLRMDILKNMDHDILLAETPESPFQEDMNIDPSPEHYSPHTYKDEDLIASLGDGSEIVIIDPNVKSPEEHNIATTEDFEELIDCGNKQGSSGSPEDSGDEREEQNQSEALVSVSEAAKIVQSVAPEKTIVTTVHKPIVMTRLPIINATVISPRPTKKLVKEVTQTTAMVSIGNTTISVPVLKNVPLTTSAPDKKLNECSVATSVSLSKSTIISVVSSGSRLSMANTISLGKLNLTSTILSASPRMSAPINSTQVLKPKIIEKIAEKPPSSPSIVYSTLSTLNISPDASLPQKIFEDESISPDSSIGNDLEDIEKDEQVESLETKSMEDNVEKKTAIADIEKELTKCEMSNIEENVQDVQNVQTMSPEEMLEQILKQSEDDKKTKEANDKPSTAVFSPQDNVLGNTITIHNEMGESIEEPLCKTAEQFEDMLTMLETITGDSKFSPVKEINSTTNVKSTDELVTTLSDNSQDSMADLNDIIQKDLNKQLPLQESCREIVELATKPSVIPVHVIIKSRESSQSPVTVTNSSRLTSAMPQLSPLSQPSELTSNVANATQQLRTIMSSVSSNNMIKLDLPQKEVQQSTPIARSDSLGLTQVNFENLLPSTKVEVPHKVEQTSRTNLLKSVAEKQMLSQVLATKPSPSSSRSESPATIGSTGSVIPTRITTQTGRLSPVVTSAGNILITGKKQRRSSPAGSPASISGSPKHSPLIGTQSPMNSPKVTTAAINTSPMAMPNLTKIQGPVKSETRPPSILGSTLTQPQQIRQTFSVNQPPALIMTSRTAPPLCVTTASFLPLSQTNFQAVISTAGVGIQPETVTLFQTISQSMANTNVVTVMKPTSTLLHSQLTGPPFRRSKSIDEVPAKIDTVGHIQAIKRHSVEMITTVKSEPMDTSDESLSSQIAAAKLDLGNTKFVSLSMTPKAEDSQNVLLKQLLQNSGTSSATSLTSSILPRSTVQSLSTHQRAPSLGLVSSLEAQLARPVIPPPTPPTNITHVEVPKSSPVRILSRETSFVSRPLQTVAQAIPQTCQPTQVTQSQGLIDVRRTSTPLVRTPIKEELISPTPKPTPLTNPTPPPIVTMQKEIALPQQSPGQPMLLSHEVKKELIDDSSQQSAISGISDQGKLDMTIKDEFPEASSESTENKLTDKTSECRKRKRREYQQNRRKNQSQNKGSEATNVTTATKKKPRKLSKMEQDYDIFIDNLMVQLRGLQQLPIIEPPLCRNFGVCPLFGSGDLAKIGVTKDYNTRKGDLEGNYGSAVITNVADFYNTKPFGDKNPLPEQPAASTQRGFYDQEFSPIKFEHDIEDRKLDLFSRDIDTPDTVYSTSSPECVMYDRPPRYPGLRLIEEGYESEDEIFGKRASPIIPLIAPVPIRLKPGTPFILDKEKDKENIGFSESTTMGVKSRFGPPIPLKESSNVTVTLTLTSAAAEDIFGVLKDLANILHIPPPTGYQIVERTTTPPSQKLGLYRTRGKDGKEGAPIDIQTILNGAAKFCRHCDVVILNSLIRAKVSEFPLLPRNNELINDTDDLYFCSKSCYKQFQWCPSSILDEKVIKKSPEEGKILITDSSGHEKDESMDIDDQNDIVIKQEIKEEDMDTFVMEDNKDTDNKLNELSVLIPKEDISSKLNKKGRKIDESLQSSTSEPPSKVWKGETYKFWKYGCIQPAQKYKKPTEKDITAMIFKVGITVMPPKIPDDIRKCIFCHQIGDSAADGPARLLNFDVDKWVHLNCALWSEGVYETVNGALMNLEMALQLSLSSNCVLCSKSGATIKCFKTRCTNIYHLNCACKDSCVFYKNKTTFCNSHIPKGEKDNELTTLSVQRRVYINRDENRQVASVMHHSDLSNLLRVGSLIFLNVGQLLPHQLQAFHTPNYIYPVGYKIVRFYWSMRQPNKRCRYICSIADVAGRPEFRVLVQETTQDDIELRDISPRAVWTRILDPLANMRKQNNCVSLFPKFVTGEDLFGLTEPAVVRVLESLPGIETLSDYRFKYGRNPLLELPLAINPTGAARSEPKLKSSMVYKKPHTQRTASSSNSRSAPVPGSSMAGEAACPYSKQFVHSKSSQYKKMKQDWRNNVYLARSKIQGLGLYAARDIEKHTMVIEYIGEVIRHELSELREKQYEARNRGIYMFRLDEERVVDATLSGGLARYINHSCNPNCVAEIIEVDREVRIIIFAKRRINRGEELSYDYKFDIEDDAHKISCMCGAPNCKKWMN